MSSPLGMYSKFSKGHREQPHVQRGFELSEEGLRELQTVLRHGGPSEIHLQSDAQTAPTMLNKM